MLRPYKIRPTSIRFDNKEPPKRGYRRADFEDAWKRYLPIPLETAATSETSETSATDAYKADPEMSATSVTSATNQKEDMKPVITKEMMDDLMDTLIARNPVVTHEVYQEARKELIKSLS
jgi:Protein of unknown function (DUF3631)